jgi:hypothetical protein
VYVGNGEAAFRPLESSHVHVNDDGLVDLAVYYPVQEVDALNELSREQLMSESINLMDFMGPVGLHYTSASGRDFLVENIFKLGAPTELIPEEEPIVAMEPEEDIVETPEIPDLTAALSARPNPFNPTTTVVFEIKESSPVSLRIYDARGSLVRTLHNEVLSVGLHHTEWNGRDNSGRAVATGVYFVRLETRHQRVTHKVVMIK